MDLGTVANIASVGGLAASIVIAVYQSYEAVVARRETKTERERATTLEAHLMRQRWHQLRSIGEQIDTIERLGRQETSAPDAGVHARLKEQFSSILAVIATSTPSLSPHIVRHWVDVGRLTRPWQIAEAVSHLEPLPLDQLQNEDAHYLEKLSSGAIPAPTPISPPLQPDEFVAAFVLVANRFRSELKSLLSRGGANEYAASVLLGFLAEDCAATSSPEKHGYVRLRCWGSDQAKSFHDRFVHYAGLDFWVIASAANMCQLRLAHFEEMFEKGRELVSHRVIPTVEAVEAMKATFPQLVEPALRVCPS